MPSAPILTPAISPPRVRWIDSATPNPILVRDFASELGVPVPIATLLIQRGHTTASAAKAFLRPKSANLHHPRKLAGMATAVERVAGGIRRGEVILVHGDYDVDGICGTALLVRALSTMGARVVPFIPNRIEHGYDLTDAGLAAAAEIGATLIVTTDCGIVAHASIAAAQAMGIDVIVTDHHTPSETLPPAHAVVNPNRRDCSYPEKGLAGAGVAFKFASAVGEELGFPEERLSAFLDLVAIATIADLAPLTAENRALVRWGLKVLLRTPNPGLRALIRTAGLDGGDAITAGQVGFVLAPRLNAVGRVSDPMIAVRLLLTDDSAEAQTLAERLEVENHRRRELDEETLADALAVLEREYDPNRDWGVVLASDRWHPGIIGIVASRIVERIHRPTVLIALSGNEGKGSARSIRGFHLHEAFVSCAEHLARFGGHSAAAGCSIQAERVQAFREAFNAAAHRALTPESLIPKVRIDGELPLAHANAETVRLLKHFEPFGIGNPAPLFAAYGVRLEGVPRVVGKAHLKLILRADDARLDAIGFGMADRIRECGPGGRGIDVVFRLEENEWRGRDGRPRRTVQARIADFRSAQ